MARTTIRQLHFQGTLRTLTGLHVGGLGDDPEVDLELAVDGRGRLYIPGTSLAGSLRQWTAQAFATSDPWLDDDLWGTAELDHAAASRIVVDDAPLDAVAERRDGVGLDRITGAAADAFKFVRAVLPRHTEIPLSVTLALRGDEKDLRRTEAFSALIDALRQGRIRLGGAKSRGLGKVVLVTEDGAATLTERSFDGWRSTIAALRGGTAATLPPPPATADRWLRVVVTWEPVGPLLVKAAADGIAVDSLPQVAGVGADRLSLLLPGSSVKGVLRSQAERIVRTVLGVEAPAGFADQLAQLPLVTDLFGRAPAGRGRTGGHISPLAVDDCYGQATFERAQWAAVQAARPAKPDQRRLDAQRERRASAGTSAQQELRQALEQAGLPAWNQAFHVAVDRWTAAPGDGLLFSVLEPHATSWQPLVIDLDLNRDVACGAEAAVFLLLRTLRELLAGRVPLGFGTNRGLGAVEVTNVHLCGGGLGDGPLSGLNDVDVRSLADLAALPGREALEARWRAALDSTGKELVR